MILVYVLFGFSAVQGQLVGWSSKHDPSLQETPTRPVIRKSGDNALLTCIVNNQGNYTLMWKKASKMPNRAPTMISANRNMVSSDKRMKVVHVAQGTIFLLRIQNVTVHDAGVFICEVNTDPPIRAFRELTVLPKIKKVKKLTRLSTPDPNLSHNFTSCCAQSNVSTPCRQYCSLDNIMEGMGFGKAKLCEKEFPAIVSCMADGKNHMPCCFNDGIPESCSNLCKGNFRPGIDSIAVSTFCKKYIPPTLSCIALGRGKLLSF